ncbi:hypothetical protein CRG98_036328 [Punica granatum]|uniref:MLO-like protein n=1 Tax=Punica granatum TaxID=22663 RepID=A0A2I0IGW0_PUNGR|nr:hypothetical protein CRG98_036328 [Punica granatum]
MAEEGEHTTEHQRYLDETATWAVATVCFVLLAISLLVEHIIHLVGKWLERKRKPALVEALEKVKAELMLLGFISLLLTILQEPISGMCISRKVAFTWRPCSGPPKVYPFGGGSASSGKDSCTTQGKVAFMTAYAIHQLHIFIFVLAIFHVLYCITTLALGTFKMRRWKLWENETKTPEHQYYNGKPYKMLSSVFCFLQVCFFRQFFGSVTKVDYLTLRHGFIIAHLTPENETRFDFQKYIHRSLEEDFKDVVGINPVIWFSAVLFLLSNAHGWYSYLWLPFIPLIIILVVGTKLQMIITKMGLKIQERGDVVKGSPVVQTGDDLFWFGRPQLILFLIQLTLFQNSFQLAFFAWSTMGSTMKPTIFNNGVATALKKWHHTAKKHAKDNKHSNSVTPFSSRPATPEHGSSPIHLLHNYQNRSQDGPPAGTPREESQVDTEHWAVTVGSHSPSPPQSQMTRTRTGAGQRGLTPYSGGSRAPED